MKLVNKKDKNIERITLYRFKFYVFLVALYKSITCRAKNEQHTMA
jgi:hypothetical protein